MTTSERSAWMDRLAHDLRGPLSPLTTAARLLRDPGLAEADRRELLDVVDRQCARLGSMIDEVSDWMRAEKGRLIVRQEPHELQMLLANVTFGLRPPPVVHVTPEAESAVVRSDSLRLGQLLRILLTQHLDPNRQPGDVYVTVPSPNRVRLSRLIPFSNAGDLDCEQLLLHPWPEPGDGGLGLSLPIARAIAEAHGGTLTCRTEGGDAIELAVELPTVPAGV
ncbi:sensor histidine kinase [Aerolutibacter daejeonensis]|uniref:sensor histidine kinase n=1 Tax=Aerolutibacter daejeonensis TaxID=346181 RepID=UPI000AD8E1F5|nr:HAMP domain-containing sensor histidine kinase [Lysobacter daejeonensis]